MQLMYNTALSIILALTVLNTTSFSLSHSADEQSETIFLSRSPRHADPGVLDLFKFPPVLFNPFKNPFRKQKFKRPRFPPQQFFYHKPDTSPVQAQYPQEPQVDLYDHSISKPSFNSAKPKGQSIRHKPIDHFDSSFGPPQNGPEYVQPEEYNPGKPIFNSQFSLADKPKDTHFSYKPTPKPEPYEPTLKPKPYVPTSKPRPRPYEPPSRPRPNKPISKPKPRPYEPPKNINQGHFVHIPSPAAPNKGKVNKKPAQDSDKDYGLAFGHSVQNHNLPFTKPEENRKPNSNEPAYEPPEPAYEPPEPAYKPPAHINPHKIVSGNQDNRYSNPPTNNQYDGKPNFLPTSNNQQIHSEPIKHDFTVYQQPPHPGFQQNDQPKNTFNGYNPHEIHNVSPLQTNGNSQSTYINSGPSLSSPPSNTINYGPLPSQNEYNPPQTNENTHSIIKPQPNQQIYNLPPVQNSNNYEQVKNDIGEYQNGGQNFGFEHSGQSRPSAPNFQPEYEPSNTINPVKNAIEFQPYQNSNSVSQLPLEIDNKNPSTFTEVFPPYHQTPSQPSKPDISYAENKPQYNQNYVSNEFQKPQNTNFGNIPHQQSSNVDYNSQDIQEPQKPHVSGNFENQHAGNLQQNQYENPSYHPPPFQPHDQPSQPIFNPPKQIPQSNSVINNIHLPQPPEVSSKPETVHYHQANHKPIFLPQNELNVDNNNQHLQTIPIPNPSYRPENNDGNKNLRNINHQDISHFPRPPPDQIRKPFNDAPSKKFQQQDFVNFEHGREIPKKQSPSKPKTKSKFPSSGFQNFRMKIREDVPKTKSYTQNPVSKAPEIFESSSSDNQQKGTSKQSFTSESSPVAQQPHRFRQNNFNWPKRTQKRSTPSRPDPNIGTKTSQSSSLTNPDNYSSDNLFSSATWGQKIN